MRIGNILAVIDILLIFLGLMCLPLWNLHELPFKADPGYPGGSGWIMLAQTGIFVKLGIISIILGITLCLTSKLLPKKYWMTIDDLKNDESEKKE